jgi:hypothetical protein
VGNQEFTRRENTMKKTLAVCFASLFLSLMPLAAQEAGKTASTPKQEEHTPSVTPLRVQVVFSEYDGDKKISNLPYTFTVNADERRASPSSRIRNGARIPVITGKDQFTYLDIGTNIDCSATLQDDGRFKLQMILERSSIAPDTQPSSGNPVVRNLRVDLNPVLKDGQSVESVASTDPATGHVYKVNVTVNVMK